MGKKTLKITITGFYVKITGEIPPIVNKRISEALVWVNPDDLAQRVFFYNDEEQVAYIGCLRKIIQILQREQISYKISYSEVTEPNPDWEFTGTYRPMQENLVEMALAMKHGVLEAPPGLGKTVIMAAIVARAGVPGIIVVQQGEPFQKAVATLRELTNVPVAELRGGDSMPTKKGINVMMIQTWLAAKKSNNKRILKAVEDAKIILVDEMHNSGADTYLQMFTTNLSAEYIIGVSATPFRNDNRGNIMTAFMGDVIEKVTYGDAIENDVLLPIIGIVQHIPFIDFDTKINHETPQFIRNRIYSKVRDNYILNNAIRHDIIADFTNTCVKCGLTVGIVVDRKEHGEQLLERIPDATCVFGDTKNRDEIWDELLHRERKVVISTLLNEATDIPSLDVSVLASGGKSKVRLLQRIRSLRKFEGYLRTGYYKKTKGFVYLPYDNCAFLEKHSKENLATLKKMIKEHEANKLVIIKNV